MVELDNPNVNENPRLERLRQLAQAEKPESRVASELEMG
jgi:hypothetical protein